MEGPELSRSVMWLSPDESVCTAAHTHSKDFLITEALKVLRRHTQNLGWGQCALEKNKPILNESPKTTHPSQSQLIAILLPTTCPTEL
jgi:hypothetical protein